MVSGSSFGKRNVMDVLQEGLIRTNEKCVGCNKCISVCSCPGATIATLSAEGSNIIKVDPSKCIACGACFDACEHHAREYVDDTEQFLEALRDGEDVSVFFAPAFKANYPDTYGQILGKLKTLGVNRFISVAFGADITTWGYLNYLAKNDVKGVISQPCPAVVEYIEKYIPELLPKLIPVQSPLMCAAIYARKHLGLTGKMAFIGPCIAKKNEITAERGQGLVSYNVTFDHLMKKMRTMDVEPSEYSEETDCGLGSIYAMPGGLKENIYWFLGEDAFVRQIDGEKQMYEYLMENKERILDADCPYTMYDALNCKDGCLCGTGVESDVCSKEDVLLQIHRIKEKSKKQGRTGAWASGLSPEERLREFNRQFADLKLEDYLCTYTDKSQDDTWKKPTEEELNVIFENMNKTTEEERTINCSCCGYHSCRDMAEAIFNGFNHKENCIHYIKDVLEGISTEYPTVFAIHENNGSIHVVKNNGEVSISKWIESGLDHLNYENALKNYIDRYVDEADRERVWNEARLSELNKKLDAFGHHSITFLKHTESGDCIYYQMNYSRMKGRKDIILSFRNIDEIIRSEQEKEKKIEEALAAAEQANKAKSSFLANMSHEIRTPINAILGMDTMILRESKQGEVLDYARNVKTAGNTLLSLINDILDFSKIESGKMEVIPDRYRLDSVINDLLNMMRPKAEEKGLDLILDMKDGIPAQLIGDEVRVKQIMINLLNNAVKYTKQGSVTMSVSYEEDGQDAIILCFAVKDTGIGIRKEDMNVLFSPYERIKENDNKLIEGTGLGLSITRSLLEKMDSRLEVESEYGEGSVFSFKIKQPVWGVDRISADTLSLSHGDEEEANVEMFHAPDAQILAVDDVEMNLLVLSNLLKRSKITPEVCLSGAEAVTKAAGKKYDLIFLDAMMPGMSGEDTLFEIKKSCPLNAETPVVVLTANAIVGARESYINIGFTDYLSKPIDGNKLESLVKMYLPAEKILSASDDIGQEGGQQAADGLNDPDRQALEALKKLPEINTDNGISASGDTSVYLTVVKNFADTSGSRIDAISNYLENKDYANYTIQVHALKSSARLIGYDALSFLAFQMEMAGKENRIGDIEENTPELLDKYREISGKLTGIFDTSSGKEKKELSEKKAGRRFGELLELMEAFDFESAREMFAELADYKLPESCEPLYTKLKPLMADVCRDEVISLLKDYFGDKK